MERHVKKKVLTNNELENLPLFFKIIYYNDLTDIDEENKLFKYNSRIQRNYMRHYEPNRVICKSFDVKKLFYEKIQFK